MLKTKKLGWTKDRFSKSILSARLISVLAFIFALSMTPREQRISRRWPIRMGGRHEGTRIPQPNEGARERADLRPPHLSFCLHFPEYAVGRWVRIVES